MAQGPRRDPEGTPQPSASGLKAAVVPLVPRGIISTRHHFMHDTFSLHSKQDGFFYLSHFQNGRKGPEQQLVANSAPLWPVSQPVKAEGSSSSSLKAFPPLFLAEVFRSARLLVPSRLL